MASVQQYIIGISLLFVALLTGYFLSWQGGMILDMFYNNGTAMGPPDLIEDIKTTDYYQKTNGIGLDFKYNLAYAICYLIPLLGVAWLWQSMVKAQSYDSYAMAGQVNTGVYREGRMRRRRRR